MSKQFQCDETGPIVQTKQGKLRGFVVDAIKNFTNNFILCIGFP